ncbi:AAA family ATPase [uncultured Hymenobacter sp.]|uniref:AAA family ATPase n=1 Tax=uncultured Hymenobacter sp. TaxID=170016 RepID=UPI0035C94F92
MSNLTQAQYLTPAILQERLDGQDGLKSMTLGKFITARALMEDASDKMATLLDPILPKTGLVALVGSSDTGKSAFLRQLALAVALGDDTFLGLPLSLTHQRAVYVSTEDDQRSVSFLTRKQTSRRLNPPADYERLLYLFESEDLEAQLDELLSLYPVDLIVLDAFSDLFEGRLNDSQFVRAFFKPFRQLATKHGCLVILLHHTGKYKDEQVPSKHHVVGSQAFEAKMRMVMELRADPVYPELRHLCVLKGNYLGREDKEASHVLTFDENLTFHPTGQRQMLETLTKAPQGEGSAERTSGYTREKYDRAVALRDTGKNLSDIAQELGYADKSAVSKLLKKKFDPATD